jgi:hypothetical protein
MSSFCGTPAGAGALCDCGTDGYPAAARRERCLSRPAPRRCKSAANDPYATAGSGSQRTPPHAAVAARHSAKRLG